MLNFVYCLDENYNKQCLNSIYSILNNTNTECTFYIIHNNPKTLKKINKKITEHEFLNEIIIKKFSDPVHDFVNLKDAHITEASYYRLFLTNYLPLEVSNIIYVDPDVVCLNNVNNKLADIEQFMNDDKFTIAAVTEDIIEIEANNANRLNLTSKKYFNAGVLIINITKWRELEVISNFKKLLNEYSIKLELHDQDILNLFFDGDYFELDDIFNFTVPGGGEKYINKINTSNIKDVIFLHYSGNKKPWQMKGIIHEAGEYYRKSYESLFKKKYHFQDGSKKNSIKLLIKLIRANRIKDLKHPIHFLYYFLLNLSKAK
jgi:lipopolysaccharide biosynthesis glycosyltransferase